jgi:hypothetical protein
VQYVYRLDGMDTVRFVSSSWLRFAQENDAAELVEERVVGHVIWDFVQGVEVRRLWATLFSTLRARREEIVVPFRCDSPSVVRLMELTLRPLPPAGIELEGRLLEERSRKPVALFSRSLERSPESMPICGLCRRLCVHQAWLEAEQAIARARLLDSALLPRLVESVCPECRTAVG